MRVTHSINAPRLLEALRASVQIQCDFFDAYKSTCAGDGLEMFFADGRPNTFCVVLRDAHGAAYMCDVREVDCVVQVVNELGVAADVPAHVTTKRTGPGSFMVVYRIDDEEAARTAKARVHVRVYAQDLVIVEVVRALSGATGGCTRTDVLLDIFSIENMVDHAAVNAAGTLLAISQLENHCVHVFELPNFVHVHWLRQVNRPTGVCFTCSDALLIADSMERVPRIEAEYVYGRVQRVSVQHGSMLAAFQLQSRPYCIATRDDAVVVGTRLGIFLYSTDVFTAMTEWTEPATPAMAIVELQNISAVCFATAHTILAASAEPPEVCMFTTAGVRLKCLGKMCAFSIMVCADATLLVMSRLECKIRVFTADGEELPCAPLTTRHHFDPQSDFATLVCNKTTAYALNSTCFIGIGADKLKPTTVTILK